MTSADGQSCAQDRADVERPVFCLGFDSAESWLVAERVNHVLPRIPEWQPVRAAPASDRETAKELSRRATAQGLFPLRPPVTPPGDLDVALRAAVFAQLSGRVVAFCLAALRQGFAGGRDLSQVDNVLIAAAACELHPRAVLKGLESRATERRLRTVSEEAVLRGVRSVPAVIVGGRVWHGGDAPEHAAEALMQHNQ